MSDFYYALFELAEYHKDLIFALCSLEKPECNPNRFSNINYSTNLINLLGREENKTFKALIAILASVFNSNNYN